MKSLNLFLTLVFLTSLSAFSIPEKGLARTYGIAKNNGIPAFLEGHKYESADGTMFSFTQVKGKVLLIDFWATWCGPCIKEHPHVVALEREFDSQDFKVVTVSVDKSKTKWQDFVRANNWTGIHIKIDNNDVLNPLNQMVVKEVLINGDTLYRTSVPQYYLVDKGLSIENIKDIKAKNTISLIRKKLDGKD